MLKDLKADAKWYWSKTKGARYGKITLKERLIEASTFCYFMKAMYRDRKQDGFYDK